MTTELIQDDGAGSVVGPVVEVPRVVPVISNGHTADGRRPMGYGKVLPFDRWAAAEEAAGGAVPSTILEDLAGERLCAGEMGHLRWLLERAAAHGQVELEEGRRVMVNAVESASVRLGVLVVRLRAGLGGDGETRDGELAGQIPTPGQGSRSPSPSGSIVGLDAALRLVGATEAMPGLLLPNGEEVDDVRAAGETGPAESPRGIRVVVSLLVGCGMGWMAWLVR